MPSSSLASARRALFCATLVLLAAGTRASPARAQQQPQGFAVERFYPSAPGGGWWVMDALDMRGRLGGAMSVSAGYALRPLRVSEGSQSVTPISDQAFTAFGFAVTFERFRVYLDLNMPLVVKGESGAVGDYQFAAPSVGVGANPDTLSDPRIGLDVRLLGGPRSPFRLGAGAQFLVPNGSRSDYDTDGTVRGMFRGLVAGDLGAFTYAGQLGVHVRPLDDTPVPGSPRGSELLFGAAAGARLPLTRSGSTVVVIGPELYGESAFRSFFGPTATGLEGLLTARVEGTADDGAQVRVKVGSGGGLDPHFGAPAWRVVVGVELFDHHGRAPAPTGP